jgi:hypothetical protein
VKDQADDRTRARHQTRLEKAGANFTITVINAAGSVGLGKLLLAKKFPAAYAACRHFFKDLE